jgi:integrase
LVFVNHSGKNDFSAWADDMQQRGLAVNTIRQRIYLVRAWLGVEADVALPPRRTVRETKWLDVEQIRAGLSVIPKDQDGRRDFALLAALLVTGLRVGQVRTWKRSDVRCSGGSAKIKNRNMPKVFCEAFQAVSEPYRDSHSSNMPLSFTASDTYLFTASKRRQQTQKETRFRSDTECDNQPLSPQEINRRIGRHARLAGLEPQGITAECLRRTCKELGQHRVTALVQEALANRNKRPVQWKRVERDIRLHGIGRRNR